jgi:hypothetical protein
MEWPARAEAVKDGAQRHPQGFVLDGFEHDGTLERVGMTTSAGSCGLVHEASCHILVCGGPKTQTMMSIGSKLRGGGLILLDGMKAMVRTGDPASDNAPERAG